MVRSYMKRFVAALVCGFCLLPLHACKDDSSAPVESTVSTAESSADDASSNSEKLPLTDLTVLPENTYSGAALVCDNIVVEAGSKKVPYRLMLYNNPGFGFVGLRVLYDEPLSPYMDESKGADEMEVVLGDAMNGFLISCMDSKEQHLIGAAGFSGSNSRKDGIMYTCYFDIPADAASGTVYEFQLEVVDFRPLEGENHQVQTVNGSITVQ